MTKTLTTLPQRHRDDARRWLGLRWRCAHLAVRYSSVACFLALVTYPVIAQAHLGHVVQQAERYIKLDVSGYQVRVVVSLSLGARETSRVMQQSDADRNGWVSPEERDAYMALWGDGLREELAVEVDGEPVDVLYGEAFMQPIGPVAAVDGAVEMVGVFLLDGGEHRITVRDNMPLEPFDRTDLSFRTRDGATLLASGIGEGPTNAVEHGSIHRDTPYPGTFSMHVRVPNRPRTIEERARGPLTLASVVLVVLGALGGVWWVRVKRHSAAPRHP